MDMRVDLAGKVALVTGASTGIGRAIAIAFADSGASVAVNYAHSQKEAEEVGQQIAEKHGAGKVRVIQADLTRSSEAERLVDETVAAFGRLDILVNNAGGIARSPVEEMPEELWDRIMALNLKSAVFCTKRAIPTMRKQNWGRIINMTSIAARTGGFPGASAYAAAKAGLSSLTRTTAKELASANITVNAIAPGIIDTPFHQRNTPPDLFQRMVSGIPVGRAGVPEEVAGTALFLASEAARYITGEVIEVNGGMLMD